MITDKYRWLSKEANLSEQYMQDAVNQCDDVYEHYLAAYHSDVDWVPADCDMYYNMFLDGTIGGAKAIEMLDILYTQGHPVNPNPPPTPPDEPGMICKLSGQFFMSGLKTPDGLLCGTYKHSDGLARLYQYNGTFSSPWTFQAESVYMLQQCQDGLPLFSTECPAAAWKMTPDRLNWKCKVKRDEPDSVAFEFHRNNDGLSLFTVNRAWGDSVRIFDTEINGILWIIGPNINGKRLINSVSDGKTMYLIGSVKDSTGQDFPIICDRNGNEIARRPEFDDQTANYALLDDSGNMSVGMNAVDLEDKYHGKYYQRNAYLDLYNVSTRVWRTIIDLTRPYIFDMVLDPSTGFRYAVETSWNEPHFNTSLVWVSKDKGLSWNVCFEVPMKTVNSIQIYGSMMYCWGGLKDSWGGVYAYTL